MTTENKTDIITEFLADGQPKSLKSIREHFATLGQRLRSNNIKTLVAMKVIQSVNIVNHATGKTSNGRRYRLVKD